MRKCYRERKPAAGLLSHPASYLCLACYLCFAGVARSATAPFDPPPPAVLDEARQIVQKMIADPRGPYNAIRWFCADGTVLPPSPYACKPHGGGRQHARYSPQRERLAELGWSVGTIYAALEFAELFAGPRQQRMRELPLERYLVDIDDGWVLRRANTYRGRVQVEGEIRAGKRLLLQLLENDAWARDNFLLVREMIRVMPHGDDTDLGRTVRREAIEIAELEPDAQKWRVEIHTSPSASIAARMRAWLAHQDRAEVVALGQQLADHLDALYGPGGRQVRLDANLKRLPAVAKPWQAGVTAALAATHQDKIAQLCSHLATGRATLFASLAAPGRLVLLDTMQALETEVLLTFQEISFAGASRGDIVATSRALIGCAYGAGLLSEGERDSLSAALEFDTARPTLAAYRSAVTRLKRAPAWALGTVRYTFAEALNRYSALDPRAARFSDDVLRESPLWALGVMLKILSQDVDRLAGSSATIAGQLTSTALALNAGVASGRLRVFDTLEAIEAARLNRHDIVVLPETIAELSPVAGILTLGEGNALSHVQLLARNFGIPNVAIDQHTTDLLKSIEGREVILVVDNQGNVILRELDDGLRAMLAAQTSPPETRVTVPMPELDATRILALGEIGRELSGRLVGPKAANLGELNRLFPGRVAPAVAIPFGVYARHLQDSGLMQRITEAFVARAAGSLDEVGFNAELAAVRSQITALRLSAETRSQLLASMAANFGEPGSYGVFVRSDTNVEDLPQFTGAGLNETLPNIVGIEAQLAAVPRVWASVLSPRALAWRANILANPAQIYASVLLMKSVPATKSGVLVTSNLIDRGAPGLTVSAAWGVGGAVAGESAESLVLRDYGVELVSEAKTPYQRALAASGGVAWLPASAGPVLSPDEISALRELAREARAKYVPVPDESGTPRPWDIEFGFVDGELTLFQIRPLVERSTANADAMLRRLRPDRPVPAAGSTLVSLSHPPVTQAHEHE